MAFRKLPVYLLAAFILVSVGVRPAGAANDQATGRLSLEIRPDLLAAAPTSVSGISQTTSSDAGTQLSAQFDLPVDIKIRLASNVGATFILEPASDPATLLPGFTGGQVILNGVATPLQAGTQATTAISRSGVLQVAASIVLQGDQRIASGTLPMHLALRSADGLLNWSGTTQLVWTAPTH